MNPRSGSRWLPANDLVRALESAVEPDPPAGGQIGPYRLRERIGEGGFGEVWMAEQREPIRRSVAVKIIKVGMDTRELIARFEAERQALALLDHPNIVRVFDTGTTETGRPYFVMELVRGVPLTGYCDAARLTTYRRVRLFVTICGAVHHAHERGVVHRDLKPANIILTQVDAEPVPKIIDFGAATAIRATARTGRTWVTRHDAFAGTPPYASPEQIGGSGPDVDPRSDVYSLGVLLYEVLVGQPPFDRAGLQNAGVEPARQVILGAEPPRLTRTLRTLDRETRDAIARERGTDAVSLARELQGELEGIVLRCLEQDRARRYPTAEALAQDLLHCLREERLALRARPAGGRT